MNKTEKGFLRFHAKNPHVFEELVQMTRLSAQAGEKLIGMGMLFEILRWKYQILTDTEEPFRLNNNYRAYYVRMIEKQHPELKGLFRKRRSQGDCSHPPDKN